MKYLNNRSSDDWPDILDRIIATDELPPLERQELLHVAERLSSALASLRAMANSQASAHPQQHLYWRRPLARHWIRRSSSLALPRAGLLVSAIVLLICIAVMGSAPGAATLWRSATQVVHTSTSLDQIDGVSIASLARPHAGLRPLPLLPTVLPANTQATTYGVLTDASDPDVMTTFVADYRINGQDVQLYEQPSDVQFLSTTAQVVQIGTRQGQLFQDTAGDHALQWYQNAMMCQLTGKIPVVQLVQIASVFQPIKSWDLIH